ncbi:expansin-like A3 isoform X3 [Aristolochia californica]|uniref:expansin-like A3 isoform X3 n=1 Tax=Aristolochia californica TaxID=171875 RepID=UPI0035D8A958
MSPLEAKPSLFCRLSTYACVMEKLRTTLLLRHSQLEHVDMVPWLLGSPMDMLLLQARLYIEMESVAEHAFRAFQAMARKNMALDMDRLGIAEVEYKRIPCEYKNQNLSVRVEEGSKKPHYLAIKFLFQGGQTDIVVVDVAEVGSSTWQFMSHNYGAVWDTDRVPAGPLQFRLVVTGGYDGKWVWAQKVLPSDWKAGQVYDAGVQITDIAQEGCATCEKEW